MATQSEIFTGSFANPVFGAQAVFRALMHGMANPATVASLGDEVRAPHPAPAAMAAIALTLLDHDTNVFLAPALAASAFPQWLAFHAGAPLTVDRMAADFALFTLADGFPDLSRLSLGSDVYPDRSATLIVEIAGLVGGPPLRAEGPGIDGTRLLSPLGLPDRFLEDRALNHALYPRGIDLVLVSGGDCLCLPRTTRLTLLEA